jgi:hypothetical protein
MLRRLASLPLLALVAGALSLPAPAAGGYEPTGPWARVKVARCSRALDLAVFHGRMRQVDGGQRMSMRFRLLERKGLGGFVAVQAPGLGKWRKSRPGVGAFGYRQVVQNLSRGAVYRVRVDFRWYSKSGKLLARARRRSPACPRQTALPNLRVRLLSVRDTAVEGIDRYAVRVLNRGQAPAADPLVRLAVDGVAGASVSTRTLAPGGAATVWLRGPECRSWVQAQVDPDGTIAESAEQDNTHQLTCGRLRRS